jgi:hypothetical protein
MVTLVDLEAISIVMRAEFDAKVVAELRAFTSFKCNIEAIAELVFGLDTIPAAIFVIELEPKLVVKFASSRRLTSSS